MLILQSKTGGDFKPHPEGIHPAVCVDVLDLGLQQQTFQGETKMVEKLRLVFESEQKLEDGTPCTITKSFTASLHPKARLAEFLSKWRGRPIVPGETIDLAKLIGTSCTLVVSHGENLVGKKYASIDAVSKPTKKLTPSGKYDPAAARKRLADWLAKQSTEQPAAPQNQLTRPQPHQQTATTTRQPIQAAAPKPATPTPAPDYDPDVGF